MLHSALDNGSCLARFSLLPIQTGVVVLAMVLNGFRFVN
jgi:hypothetical protein